MPKANQHAVLRQYMGHCQMYIREFLPDRIGMQKWSNMLYRTTMQRPRYNRDSNAQAFVSSDGDVTADRSTDDAAADGSVAIADAGAICFAYDTSSDESS